MTPRLDMVQRFRIEFGVMTLLLLIATTGRAADLGAVVSGVVRDSRGVPQMGAVVQILSPDAVIRATAYTDLQGRYLVRSLLPGSYGVRASAALFLPALRQNLKLQPGHRAIVNLTLSALFDDSAWLPARAKAKDESVDDWNWTLRSVAGRPILKLADEDEGPMPRVGDAGRHPRTTTHVRAEVTGSSNRFGHGGTRVRVEDRQVRPDGTEMSVGGSFDAVAGNGAGDSVPAQVSAGYERPLGLAGSVGSQMSYTTHPEISVGAEVAGLRVWNLSSAERFAVGDFAEVEAGSRIEAVTGPASVLVTRPFVHVDVHPAALWLVTYSMATTPDLQDYDSATKGEIEAPACTYTGGRLHLASGVHQEIRLAHKSNGTMVSVAYYADALDRVALSGGIANGVLPGAGTLQAGEQGPAGFAVDGSNGTFEGLADGYGSSGFNVLITQELRHGAWVAFQYSSGAALATGQGSGSGDGVPQTGPRRAQEATVSVRTRIERTGTKARVSYRWQPGVLVTAVDPYDVLAGGEYLSFHVRQPLALPGVLGGVEMTVDGNNLLAQGYRRFDARGVTPMYLASSPMSLRAGLAFNF